MIVGRVVFEKLFLEHPRAVGETYLEHQRTALSFAGPLFIASFACLLHAFIPGLCTRTASSKIEILHRRMVKRAPGSIRVDA